MEHKETFLEKLNLFLIGAVLGGIVATCFVVNSYKGDLKKQNKIITAYERYYINTETLLDSLDGTHNLDLMDTDLETDYGVNYLNAKYNVDSLTIKQRWNTKSLTTSGIPKKYKQ